MIGQKLRTVSRGTQTDRQTDRWKGNRRLRTCQNFHYDDHTGADGIDNGKMTYMPYIPILFHLDTLQIIEL